MGSEQDLALILIEKDYSIAFAESCTAGMMSSTLASFTGISKVLRGGIVCYQKEIKINVLGVDPKTLDLYSCESQQASDAIASGLSKLMPANIIVGITGLASSGGSENIHKPVGSIFISILFNNNTYQFSEVFSGNRDQIRSQACQFAFKSLIEILISN